MKNIFCYGDSITWGTNPADWTRYDYADRWTSVLQEQLGPEYYVTVNALSGRTTSYDSYLPYRNGKEPLMMLLESNAPLDLVIIMLGTNDMVKMLNVSAENSAAGMMTLIRIIYQSLSGRNGGIPKVMIITPPAIGKLSGFMSLYYEGKEEESKKLSHYYRIFCERFGCIFFDSNDFVKTSDVDGLHLSRQSQRILGVNVAEEVKKIL